MIFPVINQDPFIRESIIFFFYFGILASIFYIPSLVITYQHGYSLKKTIIRGLNLITWIVPP